MFIKCLTRLNNIEMTILNAMTKVYNCTISSYIFFPSPLSILTLNKKNENPIQYERIENADISFVIDFNKVFHCRRRCGGGVTLYKRKRYKKKRKKSIFYRI